MSTSPGDGVPLEKVLRDEYEVIQSQRRNRGYVPKNAITGGSMVSRSRAGEFAQRRSCKP